jgi:hypothetical protein
MSLDEGTILAPTNEAFVALFDFLNVTNPATVPKSIIKEVSTSFHVALQSALCWLWLSLALGCTTHACYANGSSGTDGRCVWALAQYP